MGPPDAARLLATPPARFTAARAALAKALADRGDPSAAAVRKLRRPTGLAWVMNRLALDRAEDAEALLAAADRLRAGQRRALAGRGADELRAADADLRERARALRLAAAEVLREEGRPPSGAALARLELLLRAVATEPGPARDAFRRGALEREPEVSAGDLSGFALVAGAGPAAAHAREGARPRREAPGEEGTAAATRRERERERREAAERARAGRAAATALARAREAERRAEAAAGAAEAEARRAEAAAARAGDRARALRARAVAAREETARREAALRDAGPDAS